MSITVFGKTMENVRKHSNIKLVTANKRRNYLVSQPNHHTTSFPQNIFYLAGKTKNKNKKKNINTYE